MKKIFPVLLYCLFLLSSCKKTALSVAETTMNNESISSERINQTVGSGGTVSALVGYDLDIDFNYSIIGDPGYTVTAGAERSGAAYIYHRPDNSTAWTKVMTIKHANGKYNDNFGFEVAIDGDNAVSCTNDSLYAFRRQASGKWLQTQAFVPSHLPVAGLSVSSIDIDGNNMIVGHASRKLGALWSVGAIYFFKLVNNSWVYETTVISPNASGYDWFGTEVLMHGNYALVGSRGGRADAGGTGQGTHGGKAYIYLRKGGNWIRQATIEPTDILLGDEFGNYVDLYENFAVIGATQDGRDDLANKLGKVYIYRRSGTSWTRDVTILSPDYMTNGRFGRGVAINGNYLVVGGGSHDGALYFFHRFGLSFYYLRTELSPLTNPNGFGAMLAMDSTQHYLVGQNALGSFNFGTVY